MCNKIFLILEKSVIIVSFQANIDGQPTMFVIQDIQFLMKFHLCFIMDQIMNIIFWLSTQQKEFGSGNSECLPENLENVIGFSASLNKKKLTVTDKKNQRGISNANIKKCRPKFVECSICVNFCWNLADNLSDCIHKKICNNCKWSINHVNNEGE